MKINMSYFKLVFLAVILLLSSCSKDDDPQVPDLTYVNGILISGEGAGSNPGSVSFVSNDFTIAANKIYQKANNDNVGLGKYLQSLSFNGTNAYIIVDNTNTITIVNRYSFKEEGKVVAGLNKPRYMTVSGNKGYVTNWGDTANSSDDFIAVVNLNSLAVENTIPVKLGPERIIAKDGKLYVTHQGAFGNNNIVSVINTTTNTVEKEITVKDRPDELYFTKEGKLVVLCSGQTLYDANYNVTGHTEGSISFIDVNELKVTSELVFPEGTHPSLMVVNNDNIYYNVGNDLYEITSNATSLATSSILKAEGYFYGLEVKNNLVYTLNANFKDVSKLNVYSLSDKSKAQTKDVALGASKIYFN